jgi:prepilin-type N-terminal cleavage/methylation domain-containing protein
MTRSPRTRRDGFTLIELLIVITIIAILASMSFGAYQKVKEAAARAACTNNIRSVGTAIQNYMSSNISFPLGWNQKTNATVFWTIRDQADLGITTNGGQPQAAAVYLCPSRRSPSSVAQGKAPADYGWSSDSSSILGHTTAVRTGQITDGIGNTILLGHIAIQPTDYDGSSGSDGDFKSNQKAFSRTAAPLYPDSQVQGSSQYMGSPHPTSVPHLYADNSVKTIDYDVSTSQTQQLQQLWQYNRKTHVQDLSNQ